MPSRPMPFAAAARAQDLAAGQRIDNPSRACHTIETDDCDGVGPDLHSILGRHAGEGRDGLDLERGESPPLPAQPAPGRAGDKHGLSGFRSDVQASDLVAHLRSQS